MAEFVIYIIVNALFEAFGPHPTVEAVAQAFADGHHPLDAVEALCDGDPETTPIGDLIFDEFTKNEHLWNARVVA